jgi:hypothetical protein
LIETLRRGPQIEVEEPQETIGHRHGVIPMGTFVLGALFGAIVSAFLTVQGRDRAWEERRENWKARARSIFNALNVALERSGIEVRMERVIEPEYLIADITNLYLTGYRFHIEHCGKGSDEVVEVEPRLVEEDAWNPFMENIHRVAQSLRSESPTDDGSTSR